jgi:GAF domain-containing protein
MHVADQDADLLSELRALLAGEPDYLANAANLSALIMARMNRLNWVGFYFLRGDSLVLGPFQGLPACTRIAVGRGVCGTAFQRNETLVVQDVHAFPGHIVCDTASRSEIVVPFNTQAGVAGVLDVDSPVLARFGAEERAVLEAAVTLYVDACAAT